MGAIWALVYSISLFRELHLDKEQHEKKLVTFSIVLGSLYAAVLAILIFGMVAAITTRLILVRIFSFLALAATIIVIAAGFMRTILHFMLKDSLISECTALATGKDVIFVWGVWTSNPGQDLTTAEAATYCKRAWSNDSASEIIWLIAEIIFLPVFTVVVFTYASHEAALAAGGARTRIPTAYKPAYPAGSRDAESTLTLNELPYESRYAPPPGAPPPFDRTLPSYTSGDEDKKDTESMVTVAVEDPFADFEDDSRRKAI